ncbi:phosphoadenosine phosphosulfate reductase domain-containing protein [Aliamphritea spongicola]|nr:phosphoadenosine phosphosulfate reductase family protein [Aliamphritea spongicola]
MALLNPVQIIQSDDQTPPALSVTGGNLNHLDRLESESIHIIREVVAEFRNPVLLYSIGKDSAVLLHLAMKALLRANCRFPCCMWIPSGNFGK